MCPDVALLWRGMSSPSNQEWTEEEDELMRRLYPKESQEEVMRALPRRAWGRIGTQAQLLGLRRSVPHAGPHPFNLYHRTVSYNDLDAAANLVDDPHQQERLREVVNTLAKQTMRGNLSVHWWLPLDMVSYAGKNGDFGGNGGEDSESRENPHLPKLYLTSVQDGAHHPAGSSRH
jgi:hypothetical protein